MRDEEYRCELIRDADGNVIARAQVGPGFDDEARGHLMNVIQAAIRLQDERDAADPEGAAERVRRQEAMRERARRWRAEQ